MRVDRSSQPIIAEPGARYAKRPPLVVDCSVIASVLFDEAERDAAVAALSGRELFAPSLIDYEIVSVAAKKSRQGFEAVAEQGLADLKRVNLTRCAVDVDIQWRLAVGLDLSAYDAAYLALAADLGAPLATFDQRLGEAARKHLGDQ